MRTGSMDSLDGRMEIFPAEKLTTNAVGCWVNTFCEQESAMAGPESITFAFASAF